MNEKDKSNDNVIMTIVFALAICFLSAYVPYTTRSFNRFDEILLSAEKFAQHPPISQSAESVQTSNFFSIIFMVMGMLYFALLDLEFITTSYFTELIKHDEVEIA